MSKWFNHAVLTPLASGISFAHAGRAALAAAGLGLLLIIALLPAVARGDEQTAAVAAEKEDSVLVTTREAAADPAAAAESPATDAGSLSEGESLEPIAESSDHTPELAGSETDDEAAQFGAALAKVAQPDQTEKPAVKWTERRTAAAQPEPVLFEPVKFQGILVGKATKQELLDAWGEPAESTANDDGSVLSYDIEPFQAVEVLIAPSEVVSAIKVTLAAALDPKKLAAQLSLDEIDPVTVRDDKDQPLGQAFPERGVLFMFDAAGANEQLKDGQTAPAVSQVAIQPLDARAFALRAENRLHGCYGQNINDLKTALALDPEFAHAQWLLAEIYLVTGQADLAGAAADAACALEPDNAAYQLRRCQALELLGEYDEAVHTVRAVLDRENAPPIVRAQSLHQMARLASLGDVQIASKAIPFDTRAIEIADQLATSEDAGVRRAAKRLLVEAHMAVADEIARQAFNQKVESLAQWVGRASGLAEDYIANDGGSVELRLIIAQRALSSMASFKPALDPAPWVAEAEEAARALFQQSNDELWRQHIEWELGIAYLNALRVEHSRRETDIALRYGQQAIENLADGASSRQGVHSSEQLVGQVYFHMGAVYAVHLQDHVKAAQWYDKAAPMLTGPRPVSELYAPRREGEMLVSIGVTHWQLGQQTRALELTQSGANLIELAVEDGILAKSALAVPYGNLATMYRQMGENTNAAKYAELARTVEAPIAKQAPRTSRAMPASASAPVQTSLQQPSPFAPRK